MPRLTALLADDEELSRDFLAEALTGLGLEVTAVADGNAAEAALRAREFDLVVTDLKMPGQDGMAVLAHAKRTRPGTPVILVTAYGTLSVAVAALRAGADDILEKPASLEDIELALERVLARARLLRENRRLRDLAGGSPMLVRAPIMHAVVTAASRVAPSKATVLIRGESGTGKECLAAWIHAQSERSEAPFVKVNCAAFSDSLLESELFGHEAGAFTGATKRREGVFELADRGTLLLDEVGETTPAMQSKLLRVLQEGEVVRVGGSQVVKVDVRIVAATNRDLAALVREGRFREDLYYRLAVVPLVLPPLRERCEEVVPLATSFLSRGKSLSTAAERLLEGHTWPGNVRELRNVIERACLLSDGATIEASLLEPWLRGSEPQREIPRPQGSTPLAEPGAFVGRTLADVEAQVIAATLESVGGNRTRAARMLGIGVRTLFNKLREPAHADLGTP